MQKKWVPNWKIFILYKKYYTGRRYSSSADIYMQAWWTEKWAPFCEDFSKKVKQLENSLHCKFFNKNEIPKICFIFYFFRCYVDVESSSPSIDRYLHKMFQFVNAFNGILYFHFHNIQDVLGNFYTVIWRVIWNKIIQFSANYLFYNHFVLFNWEYLLVVIIEFAFIIAI